VMLGQHSRGEDEGPRNAAARGEVYLVADEAGVRAAFDRVTSAGATVSQPLTQQDHGLGFTVSDAEGNVWNIGTYRPAAPVGSPGWLEIGVPETAATREFFAALFGWRVEPMPGTNNNFTGPGLRAGLHAGDGARTIVVYFSVTDIDAAVARARELGAKIDDAGPAQEGFGRFASGTDPAGVPFGLHQRA
jgi:predicted enzyme related to lactoylglutathione lyase